MAFNGELYLKVNEAIGEITLLVCVNYEEVTTWLSSHQQKCLIKPMPEAML